MARIEKSIEINTSPERVWPLMFFDRLSEWLDVIEMGECTSERRDVVGATYHVVGAMEPKGVFDVEITEYVENERAIWRSTAGNFTAFGTTTLAPTDSGTLLTFVIDYELPFSILGKIVDKIRVSKDIERSIEKGLKKMKETLEKS